MDKTQDPSICCLQKTNFRPKDTCRLKVRGWRNIYHANGCQKKARVPILILDKIDFKTKTITRVKEGHYLIRGTIQQEDVTIINIYSTEICLGFNLLPFSLLLVNAHVLSLSQNK